MGSDLVADVHIPSAASTSPPLHVVMVPYPLQGHISPLMQLSKVLASRGLAVTFVTSHLLVKQMLSSKQSLSARDLLRIHGIKLVGIHDGLLELQERDCLLRPEDFIASLHALHCSFEELVGKMVGEQGRHISCIISDSFLLRTQDVANKWRIPRISFWPNSLSAFSCSVSLPAILAASPTLDPFKAQVYETESVPEPFTCIPGIAEIKASMLPFRTIGGEDSEAWLREHVESQMERLDEPVAIIFNSFPNLERDVHAHIEDLLPPNKPAFTLGPLLPSSFLGGQHDDMGTGCSLADEDEECMQWLDTQSPRSVLYISSGSISAYMDDKDLEEFVAGLLASNQPFLWVFPSSLSGQSPPILESQIGKVIKWAPQLRVLSHRAIGAFLTHCGWNSSLESLTMGVPILGWPHMLDQSTNCWFLVEKLKVGERLELDDSARVSRIRVEHGIRNIMQEKVGELMRARAIEVKYLAQSYYKDAFFSTLDSFVSTIVSHQIKH